MKQLVQRAHIAESTVTGVLYGYHEGSVRTWHAIARALDLPLGDLLNHLDDDATRSTASRTQR
ncbi:MAG: helix-turn-helix transcriptional regulator [Propionibacteriaceae bacterium]|nr:helix-turn-helix transcriptional regulator [Propionibacteriaceae bacterium]